MVDRILFTFFVLPILAWGLLSVLNPQLALKYTLGNLFKNVQPNSDYIRNTKVSGIVSIIFGIFLVFCIFSGGFGL